MFDDLDPYRGTVMARVPAGAEIVGLLAEETGCAGGFAGFQVLTATRLLRQAGNWGYLPVGEVIRSDSPRPEVRCINFTGSSATGRILAERAGRALKRCVLELGGYNPLIVLADADLDYAVEAVAFAAFFH